MASFQDIVDEFFSDKAVTRDDCDSYVIEHFGGPVEVVHPQGRYSYTVKAEGGKTIVQFRDSASLPNSKFSSLISNTHHGLVAIPTFKGVLGQGSSGGLTVYYMDALPGLNLVQLADMEVPEKQMAYAEGLAKYVSQYVATFQLLTA